MNDDLVSQLADYGRDHRDRRTSVELAEVLGAVTHAGPEESTPRSDHLSARRSRRARTIALIAAAVAAVGVSIALLSSVGGDSQSVDVGPANTGPTPTTGPPSTDAGAEADRASEADSPPLEVTPVVRPDLRFDGDGVPVAENLAWFGDVLYAAGRTDPGGPVLAFRTTDGVTWESLLQFDAISAPKSEDFVAAGDRLVNYAIADDLTESPSSAMAIWCPVGDPAIDVHVSSDGENWTSSRIGVNLPETTLQVEDASCHVVARSDVIAQADGTLLYLNMNVSDGDDEWLGWLSPDGARWSALKPQAVENRVALSFASSAQQRDDLQASEDELSRMLSSDFGRHVEIVGEGDGVVFFLADQIAPGRNESLWVGRPRPTP